MEDMATGILPLASIAHVSCIVLQAAVDPSLTLMLFCNNGSDLFVVRRGLSSHGHGYRG